MGDKQITSSTNNVITGSTIGIIISITTVAASTESYTIVSCHNATIRWQKS